MKAKRKKAASRTAAAAPSQPVSLAIIEEMWDADQEYMPPVDVAADPRWKEVYLLGVTSAIGHVEMSFGVDRAHPMGWPMIDQLRLEAEQSLRLLKEATTAPAANDPDIARSILKRLFDAADAHAEDTGEEHNVGDLQDLLTLAWKLMSTEQRFDFLKSDVVRDHIEAGARDKFTAEDLLKALCAPQK